jgi:hypothetical protein
LSNSTDVFYNINSNCTLYVPYGSKTQYHTAAQWSEISKVVEATTAVENPSEVKFTAHISNGQLIVSNVDGKYTVDVYTLAGSLVSQTNANSGTISINLPAKGIYIVRVGNKNLKIIND